MLMGAPGLNLASWWGVGGGPLPRLETKGAPPPSPGPELLDALIQQILPAYVLPARNLAELFGSQVAGRAA